MNTEINITLYRSSKVALKLFVLSLAFVLIGLFLVFENEISTKNNIIGWFSLIFFGLGIIISIFMFFDKKPQIIINQNGIWAKSTKEDIINWEQLENAYLNEINNQKFISIVVTDDYAFKHKISKWVKKSNNWFGCQQINLNLNQLNINEDKLLILIKKNINSEKPLRNNSIRDYLSNQNLKNQTNYKKYLAYLLILILIFVLSLYSFNCFFGLMFILGISALISKWFSGSNNNSKLRKYAETFTLLGFINIVLIFICIQFYDYSANNVGKKLTFEIENYKKTNGAYPKNLNSIIKKLNLAFFENYILQKVKFKNNASDFLLELDVFNFNTKEYDSELNEWI